MFSVLASGLLCGLWAYIAPVFGLYTWAGFAGCTTFFCNWKRWCKRFIKGDSL
ncbi:DUF1097 family protein [Fervidibacillus halotolerans]|uniref:DUF1097 family protein n=1 Tax=Fervidibacillus halotolerans TaxID=2980027 RepID=A0A9E8S068_9BACI|nr:DUF1097 family protein [Fervidibacillus halotolerans]WAA12317.1 DUF1097 family protein [Fervidibacillus halotolerans]